MKQTDRFKFVIGLILLFGGLNLAILLSHVSRLYGVALIFAGIGIILWAARGIEDLRAPRAGEPKNLASKLIRALTFNGRFRDAIPIAGIGMLALVAAYNILASGSPQLGSNDYVAIYLGSVLIAYNIVPGKYSVERDFALLFGMFLFVLLVIPTTLLSMGGGEADTNVPITYYLLAMPTVALSRLLGIPVVSPVTDDLTGLPVYNAMNITGTDGGIIPVSIGLSCTGLYSVAIFVSAFIAFVAVEYRRFDRKVGLLLCLGIFLAWIANIIRMTIIVAVGRHYGGDTMEWAHNNIGELIFMAWVTVFWLALFRYFDVLGPKDGAPASGKQATARPGKGRCAICREPLSPTIPSARCECGAISHSGCILTNGMRCPSCGAEVDLLDERGE